MAATVDWGSDGLLSRQTRVAAELASMVTAEVRKSMLAAVGDRYTRSAVDLNVEPERDDSDTASADSGVPNAPSLDFDSELMKLAAGGR
jgi:FMN reductase